ncbi:MAG TPA: sigma-54 dependent transcriptional regulator [Pirellulales bacterium]|nr:sigma-54 dependent transcriptional regulator [Pirellulales bacterium]
MSTITERPLAGIGAAISAPALRAPVDIEWVLGRNPAIRRVAQHAQRAAEVECTVLISGETGTGKEIWARMLHRSGPRFEKPFIPVNCAALTSTLAESQLFGHEKGAFTGALGSSLGVFRAADGGIAFLDEIGEMPLDLQPKLLRVLQQREVTPVGAAHPEPIDVQILAATNRDLESEVSAGRFREDLFYRLNMVELRVPPLRERVDDIAELLEFFSSRFAAKYRRPVWRPNAETLRDFCEFDWPGNIRQLSHVIEQSYILDSQPMLPRAANNLAPTSLPFFNLGRLRTEAVRQALGVTRGHKGRAAKLLGVHPNTLTRLISQPEPARLGPDADDTAPS